MKNCQSSMDTHCKRNSLGVNQTVYKQLLKTLNSRAQGSKPEAIESHPNRLHTRVEFQEPYLEVTLADAKQALRKKIIVATRNLSRGGLSLLHSNFVYPGTRVSSKITKLDGTSHPFTGTVKRCDHRGGVVHEIGISFDAPVRIQEFVHTDLFERELSLERVQPEDINGNILIIGPDVCPKIDMALTLTNINATQIDSASGIESLKLNDYHLLLIAMDAGDMTGPEITRLLRDQKYLRPIILIGDAEQGVNKQQACYSEADLFIQVPIEPNRFYRALAEYLLDEWSPEQLSNIRNFRDEQEYEKLRAELRSLADTLRSQQDQQDAVNAYITLASIRNVSSILGIKSLQLASHEICDQLADSGELMSNNKLLDSIYAACA